MIDPAVIRRRGAVGILQGDLVDLQARLAAFAAGQQNQTDGTSRFVPHKPQPFRLQTVSGPGGTELRQPLRPVYQEEVAAVPQGMACGAEQILRGGGGLVPCRGAGRGTACAGATGAAGGGWFGR